MGTASIQDAAQEASDVPSVPATTPEVRVSDSHASPNGNGKAEAGLLRNMELHFL